MLLMRFLKVGRTRVCGYGMIDILKYGRLEGKVWYIGNVSVQGKWTNNTFNRFPKHEIQKKRFIPEYNPDEVEGYTDRDEVRVEEPIHLTKMKRKPRVIQHTS